MLAGREFVVVKDGNMSVIEVDSTLIQEIGSYSNGENGDLTAVIEDILRQHLFRLRQQKFDQECEYYEKNHSQIVEQYLGRYVAIHQGKIIDADEDGTVLSKRVRQKWGRTPIAIIHVRETPDWPVLQIRRPRLTGLI